jgi:hypothetical protein
VAARELSSHGQLGPVRTYGAVTEQTKNVPCSLSASHSCDVAEVKLLDGPQKGQTTELTTVSEAGALSLSPGDRIRVYENVVSKGTTAHVEPYSFADFDRRGAMLIRE